jgi:hypothetical protein
MINIPFCLELLKMKSKKAFVPAIFYYQQKYDQGIFNCLEAVLLFTCVH